MAKSESRKPPFIPAEILTWLEQLFPDRSPTAKMDDRQVWMAAGAALVVRKVRHEYEKQLPCVLDQPTGRPSRGQG